MKPHTSSTEYYRAARWSVLAIGLTLAIWGTMASAQTATSTTPTCSLSVSPSSVSSGQSATLTWVSSGANTGSLDQGLGSVASVASGSMTVQPTASTTYTGTFGGIGGTVSCSASVAISGVTSTSTLAPVVTPNYYYGTPSSVTSTTVSPIVSPTPTPATPSASIPISTLTAYPASGSTPAPMIVQIDSTGGALVRGIVLSVTPNMLAIRSWGGIWMIRSNSGSTVIPAGGSAGDFGTISAGDFVGVDGELATDQIYTIDASLVRDWTTNPYVAPTTVSSSAESTTPSEPSPEPSTTTPSGSSTDTGF